LRRSSTLKRGKIIVALTTDRPLALLLLASLGAASPLVAAAPRASTPETAAVRPGPRSLPTEPGHWLPLRLFPWADDLKPVATSLAVDARGYLWVGTPNGPIRYNGRTWRAFAIPHQGAPVAVWPIVAARDGSLWFGTEDRGVLRWQDGRWQHFDRAQGITDERVRLLFETTDGGHSTIWAGTTLGLSRCTERGCTPVDALRGLSVRTLLPAQSADGRPALWIGTDRGLLRLDDLAAPQPVFASVLFNRRNGLADDSVRCLAETRSLDGTLSLWVGTDHGLSRRRDGRWTVYSAASGFPDAVVTTLAASRSPSGEPILWVGTFRAGLARFEDSGRWQLVDSGAGLAASYVYALLATDDGPGEPTLWLATAGGVARLERERWHGIDSRAGLPHDTVLGVGEATFPDGARGYWAGTLGGMVRLGSHGWQRFVPDPAHEPMVVLQIVNAREADGSPSLWLGTTNGLRRFAHRRWTWFDSRTSRLPGDPVLALITTAWQGRETVWAGTTNGLARIDGERWTVYGRGNGLPNNEVPALIATPGAGGPPVVWAGTDKGVARFSSGLWTAVPVPCQPHPGVRSLHWTAADAGTGWLWIGTRGGVARVRTDASGVVPATCEALTNTTRPSLPEPSVLSIESDAAGRIYLFTQSGAGRLTLVPGRGLNAARLELFNREDGLPGTGFSSAFRDHLGRIWAGTTGGLAILEPAAAESAPHRQAPLTLESVRMNGRERPLSAGTLLRHDENSLEVELALLSFRREHANRFRTQLVGLDREPSAWSPEAREVYTRLPPGRYLFRAWGKDVDGAISGPLERSFTIRRPPWLSNWPIALYALVLMGLGYGFNQLRLRRLAQRAVELEALVAERTRELADANRKLEQASLTDPLTGLSNRRFVALNIEPDLRLAERNHQRGRRPERNRDLLLYLLDLDRFKDFNDRAGHPAGDALLVELAERLREVARASDSVVRWGGEEFLLISRWTDRESGEVLARRILEAVGSAPLTYGSGRTATVTCSVGWAPYPWRPQAPEAASFEQVLSLADRALYLAKREGRDRAVGVLPGPVEVLSVPEDGLLETMEGSFVKLMRTVRRGSREIPRPSCAAV